MVFTVLFMLSVSCCVIDGYRKKKGNRSVQQAPDLPKSADAEAALVERSNYSMTYEQWHRYSYGDSVEEAGSETGASSLDEAVSRKGGDSRRREPRRRAIPGNPAGYADYGLGKCLKDGRDPLHTLLLQQGHTCFQLCNSRDNCYGYSVSVYNNCLLFEDCGLAGAGAEWGQAHCHVKKRPKCPTAERNEVTCPDQAIISQKEECVNADTYEPTDESCCAGQALLERANKSLTFEKWKKEAYGESFMEVEGEDALDKATSRKSDDRRRAPAPQLGSFKDVGQGKCAVNGRDPQHVYHHFHTGRESCRNICAQDPQCYGYSLSSYNNCLVWHDCDLDASGAQWGGAHCHINLDRRPCPTPTPTAPPTEAPTKCPVDVWRDEKTGGCVSLDGKQFDDECCA